MTLFTLRFRPLTLGLLGSALLTSCASSHTAFSFQPAPAVALAPTPVETADSVIFPPALPAKASTRPALVQPVPRHRPAHSAARLPPPASHHAAPRPQLLRQPARHHASRPAAPAAGRDTWHIVLGALLIVGSVAVGLWLGGWLGLGVGAAIMLLGDYFLVLGIGGKHAWQEIFQEFFNM